MNRVKISVIVPVYNVEQWLEKCLESLVNQTLDDIEIIIVNDGSLDNSQIIVDKYVEQYPRKVKGFKKNNGGVSAARNYGMSYAVGEFVTFVDSDDYVETTMYEKMYKKAVAESAEIVVCGYYIVNERKGSLKSAQIGNRHIYNSSARQNKELIRISTPYAWNKIFKRELFDRTNISFPEGLIYEDIATVYPLLAMADKVSKVDEELYYYIEARKHSITSTYDAKRLIMIESVRLLNQRFMDLGIFDVFREQLLVLNLRNIYHRLREFGKYKDRDAQNEMIDKAFDLLNSTFPNWRANYGKYEGFNFLINRRESLEKYQSREFWHEIVEMPLKTSNKYLERYLFDRGRSSKKLYMKYRKQPLLRNCVLIETFEGKIISDSPLEIIRELLKRGGYDIFVASNGMNWEKNKNFLERNRLKVTMVLIGSKAYCRLLARAGYLINNGSFPRYFYRRDNQKYLNTWHGTPLKTFGKNNKKGIKSMDNTQHNLLQCSHLLFPNQFTKECIVRDYNLSQLYTGETIISGSPRNAVFLQPDSLNKNLGNYTVGRKFVYMPTYRGANLDGANIEKTLQALDSVLDEGDILYVSMHPNEVYDIDCIDYRSVKPFPKNTDRYEFISNADALITDYSSVMFDFSITGKTVILFMNDYDEYMANRGMYLDVRTLPFVKVYSLEDLCGLLEDKEMTKKRIVYGDDYRNKFNSYDSLDATGNLVDYIFDGNKSEKMVIEDYSSNTQKEWKVKILMERIDDKETFDSWIYGCDLENTIIVIRDRYFHKIMNEWFYKEYNDKVTYIMFSHCRLMGGKEEWLYNQLKKHPRKLKKLKKHMFNVVRERSYMRSLPSINVANMKEYPRLI